MSDWAWSKRKASGRITASTEYVIWCNMKQRCYNPKSTSYKNYGARGITVCPQWRNSFAKFLADMGKRPPNKSLHRINNDGPYGPGNAVWASNQEQGSSKRNNVKIEYQGKLWCRSALARHVGLHLEVLKGRLRCGLTVEEAINHPRYKRAQSRVATASVIADIMKNYRRGRPTNVKELARKHGLTVRQVYTIAYQPHTFPPVVIERAIKLLGAM